MKKNPALFFLFLAGLGLASCSMLSADSPPESFLNLQPAWESEAVFENPESVLFDPVARILIVSNVNGPPMKKDGSGYLSKVAINGVVLDRQWLTGLDAPKGMALRDNTLYVADISSLAVVDLTSGLVIKYPAPGSKFLNDVALDDQGRVYISDMYTDAIYQFNGSQVEVWLRDERLASPNGLFVEANSLYVGSWGVRTCGFETRVPGGLLRVDLDSQEITTVGDGSFLANIDGVQGLGARGFLVTDWSQGSLTHLSREGEVVQTIPLGRGAADLMVLPEDWELVVVPMMVDNSLKAFILPVP